MASISTTSIPPPPLPPTSTTTTVHFPRRQWVTFDTKWTLTLAVTAELAWDALGCTSGSSSNPGVFRSKRVAAARVVELVRAGRLWIGSGGRSVGLTVRPMLAGKVVGGCSSSRGEVDSDHGGDSVRELFHETVLEWPLWEDKLGLRVRSRSAEMRPGDDTTLLYFTVNHPPSPNGLYAPNRASGGIPQAWLQRVSCQLDLNYCAEGFEIPGMAATTKKGKGKGKTKPASKSRSKAKKNTRPSRSKPKKKPSPPTRSNLRPRQSEAARRQQLQMVDNPRDALVVGSGAWRQATSLIRMALHVLVGTAGKAPPVPGIRPVDDVSAPAGAPSLRDVAPAVWSSHYFTVVSSRAAYVPLIHRCLASFTNAQSPSLRRKAEALTQGGTDEFGQEIEQDGVLMTKLEEILLKTVKSLPPRPKKEASRLPSRLAQQTLASQSSSTVPRPSRPAYLPISPNLSQESPPDLQFSPIRERPPDVTDDDDQVIDLCYDNLDAIFSQSQEDDDDLLGQPREWGDCMEDQLEDDNEIEAQELNWGDIDAWSEHDIYKISEYLEDEDGLFEEINESWSPEEVMYGGNQMSMPLEKEDAYQIQHNLYGDLSEEDEESGIGRWQEMQAWQLEELQQEEEEEEEEEEAAGQSQPMNHDLGYMDGEDIEFVDIDENDLDEGVGLWRDEHDIIEDFC